MRKRKLQKKKHLFQTAIHHIPISVYISIVCMSIRIQTVQITNRMGTGERFHKGDTVGRKTEWEQRYDRPKNLRSSKELAVRSPVRACPHQNTGIVAWRSHAVRYREADTVHIKNCIMLVIPFYKDRIVLVIPF